MHRTAIYLMGLVLLKISLLTQAEPQQLLEENEDKYLIESNINTADISPTTTLLEDDSWGQDTVINSNHETESALDWQSFWHKYAKLEINHSIAITSQKDITVERTTGNIQFEAPLLSSLFFHIKGRIRYYHSADNFLIPPEKSLLELQLQQAWLQISSDTISFKLGKQKLLWGQVDSAQALDVISPFDATEQLLTDLDSIRLGQYMGLISLYANQQTLSLFYIPKANFNRLSLKDLKIYIRQQMPQARLEFNPNDAGKEFGLHYQINLPHWDLAIMAARLTHNNPVARITTTGLEFSGQQYNLIGASSSYAIDNWLLNTDISLKSKQVFTQNNPSRNLADSLELAIGIEYLSTNQHSVKIGVYTRQNLATKQIEKPTLSFIWNKNYLHDDLSLSALLIKQLQTNSLQATILANYKLNDTWQISTAYSLQKTERNNADKYGIIGKNLFSFNISATF